MGVTRRFVFLLLGGVVLMAALSIVTGGTVYIFLFYNIICFLLLGVDFFCSPGCAGIEAERLGRNTLSLYEKEELKFQLRNITSFSLKLEFRDQPPDFHFRLEGETLTGALPPGGEKIFSYTVYPQKRGIFTFKALHLKLWGRLGLCTKTCRMDLEQEYKVYPGVKNLFRYRLRVCKNRRFQQGKKQLRMRGQGTSFESLREYFPGDNYRKINWKASARMDEPIVNQYQPDKNQHVYMFVDTGRPMSYTVKGNRKLDLALNTSLVLSDVVNQNGDQSGVLVFNTEVSAMVPPGRGPEHRRKIMDTLYHVDYNRETSSYREAFTHFRRQERHRSIIFLFTDFETEDEVENILRAVPFLARNNVVVVILLEDERTERLAEKRGPGERDFYVRGMALKLLRERKRLLSLLNRRGLYCLECPPEEIEFASVNKYIEVKNRSFF
ncbi:MAG: DUF58 domain-containing protein [Halanaerobiaceae bacterium]